MMKHTKSLSTVVAIAAATTMLTAFVPSATAAGQSTGAVASARSFRVESAKRNLFSEAVSTSAGGSKKWTLADAQTSDINVPQTKSKAEQDAEAAAAARAEQARQAAQAQQQAEVSRSQSREPLNTTSTSSTATQTASSAVPSGSGNASGVLNVALAIAADDSFTYGGCNPAEHHMDCSCFVQYVFAQNGISLPRTSGEQARVGTSVSGIAQAQPGDIIANGGHSAIYLGNGMVVDAENPSSGIRTNQLVYMFPGGPSSYSIRRVL